MCKISIAFLMMFPCLFVQGGDKNRQEVSGGIVTNFLNEKGTINDKNFIATSRTEFQFHHARYELVFILKGLERVRPRERLVQESLVAQIRRSRTNENS
jgi:hypothetical protein